MFRKSLRLPGYDYRRSGAYFITSLSWRRVQLFGRVADGRVQLSSAGEVVVAEWQAIPASRPGVSLDEFVIMPDHMHALVWLVDSRMTLGQIVNLFKGASATGINNLRGTPGAPVWHRGFHDHIIRDDHALAGIRSYIQTNPVRRHRP